MLFMDRVVRTGIKSLASCLMIATLGTPAISIGAEKQRSYPPYPDKWLWLPGNAITTPGSTTLHPMSDGEVILAYTPDGKTAQSFTTTFFSATSYPSVEAAFGGRFPPSPVRYRIELKGGVVAAALATGACSGGLGAGIVLKDANERTVQHKSLLLRLDAPLERIEISCEEELEPAWKAPLVIVSPVGLLPLADDTFLVVDSVSGVVIRLGSDLIVRSDLASNRVVAVDAEVLTRRVHDFPNTGNRYGTNWPAYYDYLLHKYFD